MRYKYVREIAFNSIYFNFLSQLCCKDRSIRLAILPSAETTLKQHYDSIKATL